MPNEKTKECLTPEAITHEILYSPVTNGRADASIKNGISLIERYGTSLIAEQTTLLESYRENTSKMDKLIEELDSEIVAKDTKIAEQAKELERLKGVLAEIKECQQSREGLVILAANALNK